MDPEEELRKKKEQEIAEDELVDVTSLQPDEEEDEFILPTHPIPDVYMAPSVMALVGNSNQKRKKEKGRGEAK